jgi:hypothetical protein
MRTELQAQTKNAFHAIFKFNIYAISLQEIHFIRRFLDN